MRIAILSRGPRLYSTRRLREACRERGHEALVLNPMRFAIDVEQGAPDLYYKGKRLRDYDAVIPRIGASVRADDWCRRTLPLRRGRRSDMARLGSVRARNQPGRRWTICRGHSHYIE